MNPIRLLLVIAIIWLVFYLMRRIRAQRKEPGATPPAETRMVRCDQCGLHIPEGEAVRDDDRFFCCPEHRRQRQ